MSQLSTYIWSCTSTTKIDSTRLQWTEWRGDHLDQHTRSFFIGQLRGAEPVKEWLQSLEKPKRFQLGKAIQVLQMNGPALPFACPLGGGLYELREQKSPLSSALWI